MCLIVAGIFTPVCYLAAGTAIGLCIGGYVWPVVGGILGHVIIISITIIN